MAKASKEAKVNTSWVSPNQAYDEALGRFIERVLDPSVSARFLADFAAFREPLARPGMVNGLAQALIKITAPGVPDFYQGTELWDLNLVDPDNRRPVDFALRSKLLAEITARIQSGDLQALARELLHHWADGRVKLYLVHRALGCRRSSPEVFASGDYLPLSTTGRHAAHVCAFVRVVGPQAVVTVVPRLTARLTGHGAGLPVGADVEEVVTIGGVHVLRGVGVLDVGLVVRRGVVRPEKGRAGRATCTCHRDGKINTRD